jgi:AbrB family looped-hinge helix DNA binding protein
MSTATLTTKGQITIPVDVRNALKVEAGDRVEFVRIAPDRFEFVAATREVTALEGMFGPAKKRVTLAAMNEAIAKRGAGAK